MKSTFLSRKFRLSALFVLVAALTACASPASEKSDYVGVSIHSLNYSAREVAFISVERPGEPNSGGGGDALNPYSGGGVICCFAIPPVWHPDLKVVMKYQLYPEKEYRKALVSVPPYADGIPSDIWLIVHEDESVEAVVSQYGPSRPEWPGKVKGYPVPSTEYRVKLWARKLQMEKADLAAMEKALAADTNDLTPIELKRLKDAIQYSRKEIEYLEGAKP